MIGVNAIQHFSQKDFPDVAIPGLRPNEKECLLTGQEVSVMTQLGYESPQRFHQEYHPD